MKRGIGLHSTLAAVVVGVLSIGSIHVCEAIGTPPALAQGTEDTVPIDLVNLFAKVVLEIEPHRVAALEASNSTSDDREKDEIRRSFIRQATEIIESNGLAVADYNRITIQLRQDSDLREQIEIAIRGLQHNDV